MKALILAGGQGTRLRPLTTFTPKPIVPLVNRPFAHYQIELLRRAGVTDITFSLNYQPEKIEQTLGNGSEFGVNIRYVCEPSPMGTGGAFAYSMEGSEEPTVVMNGDILTDLRLGELIDFHQANKAAVSMALVRVPDPSRFGVADLDAEHRILRFLEKPQGKVTPNTINAGIYIIEPSVLESIPSREKLSFEYDIFPKLLEQQSRFYGYVMEDTYWRDIGTLESYLEAHLDYLAGRLVRFKSESTGDATATHSGVDASSVIGENCTIKPGAEIVNSVLGPGVCIERQASVRNSVIWSRTRVASSADIQHSIIGRGCHIGRNAFVRHGSALGDNALLPDYTVV
ncbi:hypothetical protein BH10ACI2_BH10ACI2_07130 [soil metagenome]